MPVLSGTVPGEVPLGVVEGQRRGAEQRPQVAGRAAGGVRGPAGPQRGPGEGDGVHGGIRRALGRRAGQTVPLDGAGHRDRRGDQGGHDADGGGVGCHMPQSDAVGGEVEGVGGLRSPRVTGLRSRPPNGRAIFLG